MAGATDGKPRRLGRGLSALLGEDAPAVPVRVTAGPDARTAEVPESGGDGRAGARKGDGIDFIHETTPAPDGLVEIEVGRIVPNRYQPRSSFDEASLAGLAESIRRSGLMQPVVVRPAGGAQEGGFELVAGERRWRAAQRAGLLRIPALVRALSDEDAAEWALVENLQREDLNPVERARAFERLSREFGLTQAHIAERVGIDRSSVSNLMRVLELEDEVLALIEGGALTLGHGKALLMGPPGRRRVEMAGRAAAEGWTVRRTEAQSVHVGRSPEEKTAFQEVPSERLAPALADLEKRLGEHLSSKVRVRTDKSGTRGRLVIEFFDLDHFDGLLSKFGFRTDEL